MEEEELDLDKWREEQYVDEEGLRRSLMTEEELIREYMRDNSGRFDGTVVTFDDADGGIGMAVVVGSSGSPAGQPETYIITDGNGYGLMDAGCAPYFGMDLDRIELLDWNFAILHKDGKVGFFILTSFTLADTEYDEVVAEPGELVRVRKGDVWGVVIEEIDEEHHEVDDEGCHEYECVFHPDEPAGGWPADLSVCRRLDLSRY